MTSNVEKKAEESKKTKMPGLKSTQFTFVGDQEWCLLVPAPGSLRRKVRAGIVGEPGEHAIPVIEVGEDLLETPIKSPPLKKRSLHGQYSREQQAIEDSFGTHSEMSSSYSLLLAPVAMKVCIVGCDKKSEIVRMCSSVFIMACLLVTPE